MRRIVPAFLCHFNVSANLTLAIPDPQERNRRKAGVPFLRVCKGFGERSSPYYSYAEIGRLCGCSKAAVYDSIEGVRKKFFKFYR